MKRPQQQGRDFELFELQWASLVWSCQLPWGATWLGANELGVGEAMHSKDAWAVLGLPHNATPLQVHLWNFSSPFLAINCMKSTSTVAKKFRRCFELLFGFLNHILGSPGNTTGECISREREFSLWPPITFASKLRFWNLNWQYS